MKLQSTLKSYLLMTASAASRGALETLISPSSGWFISRIRKTAADIESAQVSNAMTEV